MCLDELHDRRLRRINIGIARMRTLQSTWLKLPVGGSVVLPLEF